mgnify:FL=1
MASSTQVFVSYSGRSRQDKDFAVRLLARLRTLGIDVWVYEERGSEVPVGAEINDYCRKQIRKADVFVAVISDSSLESPPTRAEVAYAVPVFGPDGIFQISTTRRDSTDWPEPYQLLAPYKRIDASAGRDIDLERCIEDLCIRAKAEYSPPLDGAQRLPLVHRLTQEMRQAKPTDTTYEVGNFRYLQHIAMDAASAYEEGRLEHVCSALNSLEYELGRNYTDQPFYYPKLIKGVVWLELSWRRTEYLNQASRLFQEMLDDGALADKVDENLYAALAVASMKRGAIAEAIRYYRQAERVVRTRGQVDPDIIHNLIVASLADEGSVDCDFEALLDEAASCGVTSDPSLGERIQALRAVVCAKRGDLNGARRHLSTLDLDSPVCSDVLFRAAQDLTASLPLDKDHDASIHVEEMYRLAFAHAKEEIRTPIVISLAGFYYGLGRYVEALAALKSIEQTPINQPKLCVEMSWCLSQLGMQSEMEQVLRSAARLPIPDSGPLAPRELHDFFYYRGFAIWLLGEEIQSRPDFLNSRYPHHQDYPLVARLHLPQTSSGRIGAILRTSLRLFG